MQKGWQILLYSGLVDVCQAMVGNVSVLVELTQYPQFPALIQNCGAIHYSGQSESSSRLQLELLQDAGLFLRQSEGRL